MTPNLTEMLDNGAESGQQTGWEFLHKKTKLTSEKVG